MPDGRAANQACSVTTLTPPRAAPLDGAEVSTPVIGSPASSEARTSLADSRLSTAFCSGVAGASFLRRDGTVWTTDKDGIVCCLLAAELTARRGADPGAQYRELTARFGDPAYRRVDAPATPEQKAVLKRLSAGDVQASELAGEPVTGVLTEAPSNGAALGGVKVMTEHGWFAARPSGTEDVYKVYAESFRGEEHLDTLIEEAQGIVTAALAAAAG